MCGIIGVLGSQPAAGPLVDALRRLEYRGYDSAGVATVVNGSIMRRRAEGKLKNLEARLAADPLPGLSGIGHTRWATHGAPTERNAHPHLSDGVCVVHNGIIENFRELRQSLEAGGVRFETDTDTEVIGHLISREMRGGAEPAAAVEAALKELDGAFALAIIFAGHDDLMIGARRGSPLAIGHGKGEMFLGSDAMALAPFTDQITYLEEGDWVILTRSGADIRNEAGEPVRRPTRKSAAAALLVDKGAHRHFMAKEIHEQPDVVSRTLSHYVRFVESTVELPPLPRDFAKLPRLTISACGTAYYAGLVAKYWFERYARLPVDIDIASEFRYREPPMVDGGLSLFISQS
ncbi:MAG: isomerizing glutamine--fructose-6-phosphate transaminase, partial [Chitinophagales bacterium]|nr:isomerizing glutamine--fructose-6-phosphate transaminase [Hyphomicrobiales bacterium]